MTDFYLLKYCYKKTDRDEGIGYRSTEDFDSIEEAKNYLDRLYGDSIKWIDKIHGKFDVSHRDFKKIHEVFNYKEFDVELEKFCRS